MSIKNIRVGSCGSWLKNPIYSLLLTACCLLLTVSCASIDPEKERKRQTDEYTAHLQKLENDLLSHPLTLDDCICIALTNSYSARKADLDVQLAKFNRTMAFSTFMPQVAVSMGHTRYNQDPIMSPKNFTVTSVQASMPVFAPSTWFLYAAAQQGYASSKIVADYTRQSIALQTSVKFYSLLVQQDSIKALESQRAAARELVNRMDGLASEGFLTAWERDQAKLLAESREMELNNARRQLGVLQGELLQTMGLSPFAHLELSRESSGDIPVAVGGKDATATLEDLVLRALEIHPELALADRMVVIRENQVRQAFAGFIPVVSVFAQRNWYSEPLTDMIPGAPTAETLFGFNAVWNVFTGFANISRYRASKVERTKSELERESTFLSVIVRVISAEAALQDANERKQVAQRAYDVAKGKSEDYEARFKEGLIPSSDALDARADMDAAQIQLVQSQYLERIAFASLELAMGITAVPETEDTK